MKTTVDEPRSVSPRARRVVRVEELEPLWMHEARAARDAFDVLELAAYGRSVAAVGDVDGGGSEDLYVAGKDSGWDEVLDLVAGEPAKAVRLLLTRAEEGIDGAAPLGDVDGDGLGDWAVVWHDDSWFLNRVDLQLSSSGRTRIEGTIRREVGDSVDVLRGPGRDRDRDGCIDVVLASGEREPASRNAAYLHSTRTGAPLATLEREVEGPGRGAVVAASESWIAVSSPFENGGAGCVRVWDASDLSLAAVVRGRADVRHFGTRLAWVGEHEIAISGPWTGEDRRGLVAVIDVRDGETVRAWRGSLAHACFGLALALGPDLDGDGRRELAVGAPGDVLDPAGAGSVELVSLATGRRLLEIVGPATERAPWDGDLDLSPREVPRNFSVPVSDSFGFAIAVAHLDGDRIEDLVIGEPCRGPDLRIGRIHALAGAELRKRMTGR